MSDSKQQKRDYQLISQKTRKQLIDLVQEQNYPIKTAGELLKVKLSTAKLIIRKYRQNQKLQKTLKSKPSKWVLNENQNENPTNEKQQINDIKQNKIPPQNQEINQQQNFAIPVDPLQLFNWYWAVQYYGLFSNSNYS